MSDNRDIDEVRHNIRISGVELGYKAAGRGNRMRSKQLK